MHVCSICIIDFVNQSMGLDMYIFSFTTCGQILRLILILMADLAWNDHKQFGRVIVKLRKELWLARKKVNVIGQNLMMFHCALYATYVLSCSYALYDITPDVNIQDFVAHKYYKPSKSIWTIDYLVTNRSTIFAIRYFIFIYASSWTPANKDCGKCITGLHPFNFFL